VSHPLDSQSGSTPRYRYRVCIPMPGTSNEFGLCLCDTPENVSEVVRVLCSNLPAEWGHLTIEFVPAY
jgi:hypothetical protein